MSRPRSRRKRSTRTRLPPSRRKTSRRPRRPQHRSPGRRSTRPASSTIHVPQGRGSNLVVGLTGPNASGKGEAALFLSERGFAVHSLSDVVREEATRRGLLHTRDNLIATGVRMRTEGGAGALAQWILPRLNGRAVVDSIRNPGEVGVLRGLPRFVLLGIDAPQVLRFERSIRRGRLGDGATLGEFAAKEARENATTEAGQQLRATLALSDAVIDNRGTIRQLRATVRRTLRRFGVNL